MLFLFDIIQHREGEDNSEHVVRNEEEEEVGNSEG